MTEISKTKLTLTQAEEQWVTAKTEIARHEALRDEAAAVLLGHFEKTGKPSFKRVGWKWNGGQLILDQPKVREFLGDKLSRYQKRTDRSRGLQLLG
jgi:hypothetical protein